MAKDTRQEEDVDVPKVEVVDKLSVRVRTIHNADCSNISDTLETTRTRDHM